MLAFSLLASGYSDCLPFPPVQTERNPARSARAKSNPFLVVLVLVVALVLDPESGAEKTEDDDDEQEYDGESGYCWLRAIGRLDIAAANSGRRDRQWLCSSCLR
jgi:hypothetical protein